MNDSTQHAIAYFNKGIHLDGRKLLDMRHIKIQYGCTKSAEGSACVKLGETEVIAGVKMAVETPYGDTQDQGNLAVNVELLPLSSPAFESGPPGIMATEIARVVDRGIREAHTIDQKKLCIVPGEKVWSVMIDICTVNDAGNLLDVCSLAALAALKDARFPGYDGEKVDYEVKSDERLPLNGLPISITVSKIGDHFIVDPDYEEEPFVECRLTTASKKDGTLCAFQKGGDTPLTSALLCKMVDISLAVAKNVRKSLED